MRPVRWFRPSAAADTPPERSDEALMSSVRDGRRGDLAVLFERHHVRLYNHFLRLGGSRPAAEDMVQELFVRLLKYRHTWENRARFTTWMYAVARNVHIDQLQRRRPEIPLDDSPEPAVSGEGERLLERAQETSLLELALRRLPLPKREVLLLSRYQEMSYGEIARLTGRSEGAVKVLAHRAVNDLRRIFLELRGGPT